MWVINLLFPALIGTFFIFTLKFLENNVFCVYNHFFDFSTL